MKKSINKGEKIYLVDFGYFSMSVYILMAIVSYKNGILHKS